MVAITILITITCAILILYYNEKVSDELFNIRIEMELINMKLQQEKTQCNENR